jgi:hypothetical protein
VRIGNGQSHAPGSCCRRALIVLTNEGESEPKRLPDRHQHVLNRLRGLRVKKPPKRRAQPNKAKARPKPCRGPTPPRSRSSGSAQHGWRICCKGANARCAAGVIAPACRDAWSVGNSSHAGLGSDALGLRADGHPARPGLKWSVISARMGRSEGTLRVMFSRYQRGQVKAVPVDRRPSCRSLRGEPPSDPCPRHGHGSVTATGPKPAVPKRL